MGTLTRSLRRSLTAVLTAALGLGLLSMAPPVRSEPVGVPVPTFRGGTVTAWGSAGDGRTTVPDSLAGKIVTAVAAGPLHSLALTSDGKVTAWGSNSDGQATVPGSLTGKFVTAVAAGDGHSLALTSDGKVTAWGSNFSGQTTVPPSLADKVVTAIAASGEESVVSTSDGKVTVWGRNAYGQAVVPTSLADKVVTAIAAGETHVIAIGTSFVAEGKPVTSGDPVIGGTLTATASRYTATPDRIDYQWYADGATIIGATAPILRPAGPQLGQQITVRVTAVLGDHPAVVATSDPTGPVVRAPTPSPDPTPPPPTETAPTVRLDITQATLRRGQAATLSWSSSGVTTLVAAGAWAGPRAASGSVQVMPTTLGVSTYVLTATNAVGATTAQVQVIVTRPAKRLEITTPKGKHRAGTTLKVTVRGLEAGETYTIRVGEKKIAGTAKNARPLVRSIPLPRAGGRATIRVTGDQPDRVGTTKVRVVRR
jgi:Regulator of Chromosome Condensation (RCC1) repeat protein